MKYVRAVIGGSEESDAVYLGPNRAGNFELAVPATKRFGGSSYRVFSFSSYTVKQGVMHVNNALSKRYLSSSEQELLAQCSLERLVLAEVGKQLRLFD